MRLPVAAVSPADEAAVAGSRVGRAVRPAEQARGFILLPVGRIELDLPAIVQAMLKFCEVLGVAFGDVIPDGIQIAGARNIQQAAIRIGRQAEGGTPLYC
jgi:hypothetical protein